jgi:hypothetical protein
VVLSTPHRRLSLRRRHVLVDNPTQDLLGISVQVACRTATSVSPF